MSRHLPLITTRIQFTANKIPALPAITPRTFFAKAEGQSRDLTPSEHGASGDEEPGHVADENRVLADDESELSDDPEEVFASLVPKPAGEPGRPNSGGYSLEDALAPWGKEQLGKVMKFTKKMADLSLETKKSYSKQNTNQVARNHPILNKYEDHWPTRAILKMHLKATSENFRRDGLQRKRT
ncbi:hypothetical protein GALMADRAFT_148733 [Galerina marginata CBS 339.88]|uniref:Uncharacterized protein n=1 Tax=Galerina marginata (strain CBS 339.88) TaxID=685588 RepID=A0A067SCA3_GALM3|nr:hypothetical protein GALMADRAFT_148733 [Galerina marginata CBS 339.88]